MVVWLFAGGGESEAEGLVPFLEQRFPTCRFERKTPVRRKPGAKPKPGVEYGRTGKSLEAQIKQQLQSLITICGRCGNLIKNNSDYKIAPWYPAPHDTASPYPLKFTNI